MIHIKTENIKKGMEIKNYKELCNILNIKVKAGNSKKAQLKDLERYCKYHKEGNRFIIDSVYRKVKTKQDKRKGNEGGNNSIYEEYIEKILLFMCKNTNDSKFKKIELSVTGMLLQLNMINQNFNIGRQQIKKFSRYLEIPIQTIYDFYNSTYSNLESNVIRVLNKLQNRCLIDWSYITKVKTMNGIHRKATDKELEDIKEIELKVLKSLKYNNKKNIFIDGKWNDFNKEVCKLLRSNLKLEYSYRAFKIITTKDFRKMVIDFNHLDIVESKSELNCLVHNSCNKSATNRHIKAQERNKDIFGTPKTIRDQIRIRPQYIKDSSKVIKICIDTPMGFNYTNLAEELYNINNNCDAYSLLESLIDEENLENLL